MMEKRENVFIMDHPLIQHKISHIRDIRTGTNEFRKCIEEIAMLMGYEALRDLPVEDVEVETPIEKCMTPMLAGKKLAVVPILRAGLGMVNGILALVPSAKVGHIGLYRDPETHEPHEYYCKLPEDSLGPSHHLFRSGNRQLPIAVHDCHAEVPLHLLHICVMHPEYLPHMLGGHIQFYCKIIHLFPFPRYLFFASVRSSQPLPAPEIRRRPPRKRRLFLF